MASTQAKGCVSSSKIPASHEEKHKKLTREVVPVARAASTPKFAASAANTQDHTTTIVAIENSAQGALKFHAQKDWNGSVFGIYPDQIDKSESATFTHKGKHGSEGGVVYKGPSEENGEDDRAWVIVWQALGQEGNDNKVHVEAGYLANYSPPENINWDDIRGKLKSSQEYYKDKETDDAEASAKITLDTHKPDVSATFSIAP